jgi:hypothetical protein
MRMEGTDPAWGLDEKRPWKAPVLRSEDIRKVTGDFSGIYFDGGSKGQNTPMARPR